MSDTSAIIIAQCLEAEGRQDEAKEIWRGLLAAVPPDHADWRAELARALLHSHLGETAEAARRFQAAYDAGFRYPWSFNCDSCVHNGFHADRGMFQKLLAIRDAKALFERIKRENGELLARLEDRYGRLAEIDRMTAEAASNAESDAKSHADGG